LRQILRDGPIPAAHIWSAAKANGIADRTLKRAKTELGIKARRHPDLDGGWEWVLPEGGQKPPKGATFTDGPLRENLAPFDKSMKSQTTRKESNTLLEGMAPGRAECA
jgi:hypothetical protein